ncbi:IS5 family transposase [Xenorhabdus sp. PB62.4]|uniref:IS5 family transposase n=1 Tax=Xenorhabdus sp. PB62.4 TaxID=1851573 RepID=UPI0021025957|nr:IS5 family transposase [Xenorhabdus sp. PB62.4]MBC8952948.1 transposase [Xenorhabdus sp. PB62.4]
MPRTMLPASLWNKLFLFMQQNGLVYNKEEYRLTFEGILYRMRTGIPWRDLPDVFGKWNTVFRRFNVWSKKAFFIYFSKCYQRIQIPNGWLLMAVLYRHISIVRVPPQRKMKPSEKADGLSTKIHLAVDSYGLPVHFELSGGQTHDIVHAESLVTQSPASDFVIADKGYDIAEST